MPFHQMYPFLEQARCPSCKRPVHWGITTRYDKKKKVNLCDVCGAVLEGKE